MSAAPEIVTQELEVQAAAIAKKIPLIQITDQVSLDAAVADRAEIKYRLARIGELMDPICEATNKAHKSATTKREQLRGPFVDADKAYSRAMGAYEQEQERLRREAAEQERRKREVLEAAERERVAVEQRRLLKEAEEQRLTEAALAEARGDTETAERLVEAPIHVPVVAPRPVFVPVAPAPPKPVAAGVSFRDNWDFEIVNAALIPREYLVVDAVKIRGVVRAMKDATNIPGVKAVNERIAAQRK